MSSFLFYTSKKRHTRLVSDWSSDVCSSDLRRMAARDCRSTAGPWRPPRSAKSPPRSTGPSSAGRPRSEEHTSELQSLTNLVCRLLLEKKKEQKRKKYT